MGKQKTTQRTKGNVKASSSAAAAEMLEKTGGGGFVGFDSMGSDFGYVPTALETEEADSSVDSHFRMVLRKLSKRDAKTKVKALQEFSALCREKDAQTVISVLPYWPRIYCKIAIDHDRRVREESQLALLALVSVVGRELAPHLRGLMGCWFCSLGDNFAPVRLAAKQALDTAFAGASKQADAIAYCKDVIIAYIMDNLFVQLAQTLSDPKVTDAVDMEQKYTYVLSTNLSALRRLMLTVPKQKQDTIIPALRSILDNAKFWKMGKHTSNTIRAGFYNVLSTYCQVHLDLANEKADKICTAVLHNLDVSDPMIGPAIWEAAMLVISVIEDCWSHVNARKGMLPRLWTLLKEGGGGLASVIYPNLLPLLQQLPQEIIGTGMGFYQAFFENLRAGLCVVRVKVTASEMNAVIATLFDCAKYIVSKNIRTDAPLCQFIVEDQVLPVVEASVTESFSSHLASAVHPCFVDFSAHVLELADDHKLFMNLWTAFAENSTAQLQSGDEKTIERLGDLLVLFSPKAGREHSKPKKSGRVSFVGMQKMAATEEESGGDCKGIVRNKTAKNDDNETGTLTAQQDVVDNKRNALLAHDSVQSLICLLCKEAYEESRSNSEKPEVYLIFFARLCQTSLGERLMKVLSASEGYEGFAETLALPLMKDWEGKEGLRKVIVHVVAVYMAVFKELKEEQKVLSLETALTTINNPVLLQSLMASLLSKRELWGTSIQQWLAGPIFGEMMVSWMQKLRTLSLHTEDRDVETENAYRRLLRGVIICCAQGSIVGEKYMEQILTEIQQSLPSAEDGSSSITEIETRLTFVCNITSEFFLNFKGCMLLKPAKEHLLALFTWSCNESALSTTLLSKIEASWRQCMKAFVQQTGGLLSEDSVLIRAAKHLHKQVTSAHISARLEKLATVAVELGELISEAVEGERKGLNNPIVNELFSSHLLLSFSHNALPEWSCGPIVSHSMFLPTECPGSSVVQPNSIPDCMRGIAFTSTFLPCLTLEDKEEKRRQFILDTAFACALGNALLGHRKEALHSTELAKVTHLLENNLIKLLDSSIPVATVQELSKDICSKALAEGHLWSQAAVLFHKAAAMNKQGVPSMLAACGGVEELAGVHDLPTLHTLDALMPELTTTEVKHVSQLQTAFIMSVPQTDVLSGGVQHLYMYNQCIERVAPTPDEAVGVLASLYTWRNHEANDSFFAFDSDVTELSWPAICLNVEFIHLFRLLVQHIPKALNDKHWDFILCSLASWVQSISESESHLTDSVTAQYFTSAVCDLLTAVSSCVSTVLPGSRDSFPDTMETDWTDFFCPTIYGIILPLYMKVAAAHDHSHILLGSICSAASTTPLNILLTHTLEEEPRQHAAAATTAATAAAAILPEDHVDEDTFDPKLTSLLNQLTGLLVDGRHALQMSAFLILDKLMPEVAAHNERQIAQDEDKEQDNFAEKKRSPCHALISTLDLASHVVELVLKDTVLGESMLIEAGIEEYTYTTAYLLAWKLLLTIFKAASSELRAEYAAYLSSLSAVDIIMLHVMRLMPDPSATATDDTVATSMFTQRLDLSVKGVPNSESLQKLACHVYYKCLEDVPALLRNCWSNMDKKSAGIIDRFTNKYASSLLSTEQIRAIDTSSADMGNMTVKTLPQAHEVIAQYTVDEISMELVISLPKNHPLGKISVEGGRKIGIPQAQWRNWMLQLTSFLNHQNGSILDGLLLWKQNLDKHFEGMDDCMICFQVVHFGSYQLPRKACRTCKKKFHNPCLYKWFGMSQNTTCPACREMF